MRSSSIRSPTTSPSPARQILSRARSVIVQSGPGSITTSSLSPQNRCVLDAEVESLSLAAGLCALARGGGGTLQIAGGKSYRMPVSVEYHIQHYDLEQGALEIQYIKEFFGEFPRKKT